MAEFADPSDLSGRYAAIEQAYCEDRWSDVLGWGQSLLQEVSEGKDATSLGLRQRVQLLMAHTHLYGFGDRDAAESLYRTVLEGSAEPALRRGAEEGLLQCDLPVRPPEAMAEDSPGTSVLEEPGSPPPAATSSQRASSQAPAMPWLGSGQTALVPEVVEEPELIEVHQADPALAEEIELVERQRLAPVAPLARQSVASPAGAPQDGQDSELVRGLLRVVIG
jgi:hypothetical protein